MAGVLTSDVNGLVGGTVDGRFWMRVRGWVELWVIRSSFISVCACVRATGESVNHRRDGWQHEGEDANVLFVNVNDNVNIYNALGFREVQKRGYISGHSGLRR